MPIIKPTLSSSEETRYARLIAELITQLKRAQEICEPIHMGPYETRQEGKAIRYEYNTLIEELETLDPKVAPAPFLLELAYAAIGQQTVMETSTSPVFFKGQEKSIDSLLNPMMMLPNPVHLMLLRSITYDLSGERVPDIIRWEEDPSEPNIHPVYLREYDDIMRASYEGAETEYGIKKTRVKMYQTKPDGMWPIEGALKGAVDVETLFRMNKASSKTVLEFDINFLSKYTEAVNTIVKADCDYLRILTQSHYQEGGRYKPKYQYEVESNDSWLFRADSPPRRARLLKHVLPCNRTLLRRLAPETEALRKAIINNERWYKEKEYQYAYYFRYLFNAYKAYDNYETAYQVIRNQQGFLDTHLPVEALDAIKAVKKHLFDKLIMLAEIKLNQGWQDVVSKGKRANLRETFGECFEAINQMPAFECMKKLFQSKQWCFLQGKIANAILYYQKHPDLMNENDFDALAQFASHLLKHHSETIQKDVKQQLIVLGIILSIVAAGLAVAIAPGGPVPHVVAGGVEAVVIAEVVVGLAHLSHGLHEALEKVKHIKTTGRDLPLNELCQEVQQTLLADSETIHDNVLERQIP